MRTPASILVAETRALLTRLAGVRPFALQEPTLPAAAITRGALIAVERHLAKGRFELKRQAQAYLRWLERIDPLQVTPRQMHERYMLLRLQFNTVLSNFDMFSDAITQRSEHGTGVWLAGFDAAATDALNIPGDYFEAPPLICYLDRGPGGAIRRARTRLPGGSLNPVAIIRIPRERMIGAGVASSLVHEAGHQGAALLDLTTQVQAALYDRAAKSGAEAYAWRLFGRWVSEVLADLWGVARVGVTATLGLMGVVSVPRPFQFRISDDDPHPAPFIRVLLSCAFGDALYPDPQWQRFARLWRAFYPTDSLDAATQGALNLLMRVLPAAVALIVNHRPTTLRGNSVGQVLVSADRTPVRLRSRLRHPVQTLRSLCDAPPTLAMAAIGQARADGSLDPLLEARGLEQLLTHWALSNTFQPKHN